MWIADTDFKCPQPVIHACVERMEEGIYGYPGISEAFKEAVAFWMKTRFNLEIPRSAVEYVPGVIPGIICAIRALSRPGDYVAVLTPAYPPFQDMIEHNGLKTAHMEYDIKHAGETMDKVRKIHTDEEISIAFAVIEDRLK